MTSAEMSKLIGKLKGELSALNLKVAFRLHTTEDLQRIASLPGEIAQAEHERDALLAAEMANTETK